MAHLNAWNPNEAKNDFEVGFPYLSYSLNYYLIINCLPAEQKAALNDPSLAKTVQQQLCKLEEMKKEKDKTDKAWLSQAFGNKT